MYFGQQYLDQLRAALPVKNLVERQHQLRKVAAHEWRARDDNSLTVNSEKNLWHDFSKDQGGDAFDYLIFSRQAATFEDAVEVMSRLTGIPMPGQRKANGGDGGHGGSGHAVAVHRAPPTAVRSARSVTAAYDYVDADGALVYQVCRLEWEEGGKRRKSFFQRRPRPDGGDGWVCGLDAGEYVQTKHGDFWRATGERTAWRGQRIMVDDAVAHRLYRFDELREEMLQPPEERRVIFLPEGEKDVETLREWGCAATTNSGGAKNWHVDMAAQLEGADVVVLLDNDAAGRERGLMVASSLHKLAGRVRVLAWPDYWPQVPDGGDITDWRDYAGGSSERLFQIIEQLPTWAPVPPVSKFGAIRFVDLDNPRKQLDYLIRGVITRGEVSLWYGASGCGKSFLLSSAAFAIARGPGVSWMGCKVRPGLVIYQAGESGMGFQRRMKAYRQFNHIPPSDDLPFIAFPVRINLWKDDADTDALITEIRAWSAYYEAPLELVVIDTFNTASTGADENSSRDVGPILARARRIANETHAHVAIIHHLNAKGDKPRGHTSLFADADNCIEVWVGDDFHEADGKRRPMRAFRVTKMRDGSIDLERQFVLRQVEVGVEIDDVDGERIPITSCVVEEIGQRITAAHAGALPAGWANLNEDNQSLMRCLVRAIRRYGRPAPAGVEGVPAAAVVVSVGEWRSEIEETYVGHGEITRTLRATIKQRVVRACDRWGPDKPNGPRLIGKSREFVWRTGRLVLGVDELPREPAPIRPVTAPDEHPDDVMATLSEEFENGKH